MLESLGHEPTALGVARLLADVCSAFVLDPGDAELAPAVEELGLRAVVTPVVMVAPDVRADVGRALLEAL
jgi:LPPG:FO 2-phospho-L-lactate transferase